MAAAPAVRWEYAFIEPSWVPTSEVPEAEDWWMATAFMIEQLPPHSDGQ